MMKLFSRRIVSAYKSRPRLCLLGGFVTWIFTTLSLLYLMAVMVVNNDTTVRMIALLIALSVLALHFAVTIFLSDAWKIRSRKLDRENRIIAYLRKRS